MGGCGLVIVGVWDWFEGLHPQVKNNKAQKKYMASFVMG